jgi:phosphatidylserine/phosphatidylglycerophosphate/cardiolipin synthase-like enzyme
MDSAITVRTLTDGGQSALDVAGYVRDFLAGAKRTLELAHYDFNLGPETAAVVGGAIRQAAGRGVAVRIVYNVDHVNPIPVPPPSEPDMVLISSLGVPSKPIAGIPDLMHHKYVIRDGETVLTGSTNWTDDSWTREENVFVIVASSALARAFELEFEELWSGLPVEETGKVEPRPVAVGSAEIRAWFTPGYGEELSHRIAKMIGRAKRRIRIASPIITAAPVLGTLAQVASDAKVDLAGVVDLTQVQEVLYQWHGNGNAHWKIPLLVTSLERATFSAKRSTPWGRGTVHDFMHAKVTVADDEVFVGSFNLSHSGERNAENVLEIRDAELADRLAAFIDGIRGRYPRITAADLNQGARS